MTGESPCKSENQFIVREGNLLVGTNNASNWRQETCPWGWANCAVRGNHNTFRTYQITEIELFWPLLHVGKVRESYVRGVFLRNFTQKNMSWLAAKTRASFCYCSSYFGTHSRKLSPFLYEFFSIRVCTPEAIRISMLLSSRLWQIAMYNLHCRDISNVSTSPKPGARLLFQFGCQHTCFHF